MAKRRNVDDLSVAELEQVLMTRRREERMQRLRERGIERDVPEPFGFPIDGGERRGPTPPRPRHSSQPLSWKARLLTVIEVLALAGFVTTGALWYWETRQTDLESAAAAPPVAQAEPESAEQPQGILPGNPSPPPGESQIPPIYQEWIQPSENTAAVPLGDLSDQRPTRIVIPKINLDAPVVLGDDWEALKRGAGHHPGTAYPGERGNMVISAHNDIFGELFRHLEKLEPGDEFTIYDAANQPYRYVVRTKRVVDPDEVSVLNPSPEPLATLITCHPYLIDSQRLVIQAELQR